MFLFLFPRDLFLFSYDIYLGIGREHIFNGNVNHIRFLEWLLGGISM